MESNKGNNSHFLTVVEAARALNVGRSFVYRLIASGRLPLVKLGGKSVIPSSAVERFANSAVEAGRVDPDEPAPVSGGGQ